MYTGDRPRRCGDCVSWQCKDMNLWIGKCDDEKAEKFKQKSVRGHSDACDRYEGIPSRP